MSSISLGRASKPRPLWNRWFPRLAKNSAVPIWRSSSEQGFFRSVLRVDHQRWGQTVADLRHLALNWLRVSTGRPKCPKAAAELDLQSRSPDRVECGFLEHQNGWNPPWASDSHAIGSGIV